MSDNPANRPDNTTQEGSAGSPANLPVQQPTEEDLDQRDRDKARPRRAAGPPLHDDGHEGSQSAAVPHEPPPSTDPMSDAEDGGSSMPDPGAQGTNSHNGDVGLPADYAPSKPSHDELDRRDRQKSAPRRAAGPPLGDAAVGDGTRGASAEVPPPATDPGE